MPRCGWKARSETPGGCGSFARCTARPFRLRSASRFSTFSARRKRARRNAFVGLAYTVSHKDLVFLFYFAVSDDRRGAGYGTAVLEALGHRYSGKRMVLSIEALEEASPNIEQRRRRKAFYLRCGFQEAGFTMREQGVAYEILCRGGAVPFEDYRAMLQSYMGQLLDALFYRRIRPKAQVFLDTGAE